jgi:hypothetical protein
VRKFILLNILAGVLSLSAVAQKQIANQFNGWYMYFGNHKLSDNMSLHTEYQWRRSDWIVTWQQSLLRLGLDYKLRDGVILSGGYGYITTWPYGEQPVQEKFDEHRIWEQLILTHRSQRFHFNHRYRLEQRWIEGKGIGEDGYIYRNRLRYRFMVNLPLNKKEMEPNALFLSFYDEILIQFGKNFDLNYLDQNRIYGALGFQFSSSGNVQLGYMQQYLIKGDGLHAERNHTLQVALTFHADWRKKE